MGSIEQENNKLATSSFSFLATLTCHHISSCYSNPDLKPQTTTICIAVRALSWFGWNEMERMLLLFARRVQF